MDATIERSLIHKGAKFDFEHVRCTLNDGTRYEREVVRHPGAVCILGVLDDGRVVLIRNYRLAVEGWEWELPAGTLEAGEAPDVCAARELEEETGYRAAEIVSLGTFLTTPGMTNEVMHVFCARGLVLEEQRLEVGEHIEVFPMSVNEVFGLIDTGEMRDAKSMLTLMLAVRRGLLPPTGSDA